MESENEVDIPLLKENPLKSLSKDNTISIEKILNNLINNTDNLELKTEIHKPKELASLVSYANYLKENDFEIPYNTIMDFIEAYLKYMVSFNRMSRTEIIKALTPSDTKIKDYMDSKFSTKLD